MNQELKPFDKVMLLEDMEFSAIESFYDYDYEITCMEAGDIAAYLGSYAYSGVSWHILAIENGRVAKVEGEKFTKCGHCESCEHFHPIQGCLSDKTNFLEVVDPDYQSCFFWGLSEIWKQEQIKKHGGG